MKAIVISTVTGRCLPVLLKSIEQYVPADVEIYIAGSELRSATQPTRNFPRHGTNFGEAYNFIVNQAFARHDEIIVANDDVVLTPSTYEKLANDVKLLKEQYKVGWVACKTDHGRPSVTIKQNEEGYLCVAPIIAPLFGYISKEAWVDYPPLNWYSDDIQCIDITNKGYTNFTSRAYVHHVGSDTIGNDNHLNHMAAKPWIEANRPELLKHWFA